MRQLRMLLLKKQFRNSDYISIPFTFSTTCVFTAYSISQWYVLWRELVHFVARIGTVFVAGIGTVYYTAYTLTFSMNRDTITMVEDDSCVMTVNHND